MLSYITTQLYTNIMIVQTEFFAYDIWELTSGLGGLMGVFLGWSFLYIIVQVQNLSNRVCIMHEKIRCCIKKKDILDAII